MVLWNYTNFVLKLNILLERYGFTYNRVLRLFMEIFLSNTVTDKMVMERASIILILSLDIQASDFKIIAFLGYINQRFKGSYLFEYYLILLRPYLLVADEVCYIIINNKIFTLNGPQ